MNKVSFYLLSLMMSLPMVINASNPYRFCIQEEFKYTIILVGSEQLNRSIELKLEVNANSTDDSLRILPFNYSVSGDTIRMEIDISRYIFMRDNYFVSYRFNSKEQWQTLLVSKWGFKEENNRTVSFPLDLIQSSK